MLTKSHKTLNYLITNLDFVLFTENFFVQPASSIKSQNILAFSFSPEKLLREVHKHKLSCQPLNNNKCQINNIE